MSTTNLSAKIAEFRALCNRRSEVVVQKSLIRTGTMVIVESPVDKGRFAANWQYAFGAIDTTTTDGDYSGEGEKAGSINRLTTTLSGLELGRAFFMGNSLPYAQRLEWGWSAKSSFMVQRAVAAFPAIVSEEIARAK